MKRPEVDRQLTKSVSGAGIFQFTQRFFSGLLSEEEKEYNKGLSRFRVRVEHKIGQVKRFRIVSDRFRNPRRTHFTKTSIIAGIVNMESGFEAC